MLIVEQRIGEDWSLLQELQQLLDMHAAVRINKDKGRLKS